MARSPAVTNNAVMPIYVPDEHIVTQSAVHDKSTDDMFKERQDEFINQPLNDDHYIDLEKGLLIHGVKDIDLAHEERYVGI